MKKLLESVSKGILYFFSGVFFTLSIFAVIVIVLLYNENSRLRDEISALKYKVEVSEIKPDVKKFIPDTIVEEKPDERKPAVVRNGISWHNWQNIKNNMTVAEIVGLIGNPTQIVSLIDTTKYIYKEGSNEGTISFNRQMRVIEWDRN